MEDILASIRRILSDDEVAAANAASAPVTASAARDGEGCMRIELDGRIFPACAVANGTDWSVFLQGEDWIFRRVDPLHHEAAAEGHSGRLTAPMSGRVTALFVAPHALVALGAPLLAMEAMKMEHVIKAPAAGHVSAFLCAVGDQVGEGAELLRFEAGGET